MNRQKVIPFSIFILTACAPPKPPEMTTLPPKALPQDQTFKTHSAKNISSWTMTGAVAVKNKKEAWSASFNWKQNGPDNYQIHLFGPLGGGSILIEKKSGSVFYQDNQKRITSNNTDDLIYQQTGIHIPIHNLYYWIRGLPAPGTISSVDYDQNKHLSYLKQTGYTIKYVNYTNKQGIDLPSKLLVHSNEGHLKLIIKHWEIR